MTAPAIGQTSATRVVPYLSVDMFKFARRGVDTSGLLPKGDDADQLAALADYIRQASAMADSFLLGTLRATTDTEVGPVTIKPNGCAVIVPRNRPIIALTALALGPNVAQLTSYTDLSAAAVEDKRILIPVGPFGIWRTSQGPIQLGTPSPVPGELYGRWSTCNGYPVTWLTASAAAAAVTIDVADVTGIVPNQTQLVLQSGRFRFAFVPTVVTVGGTPTTLGTGPGTLTVPALPQNVDNDPLYPTYVSALPADVEQAVILFTRGLIKKADGGNVMAASQTSAGRDPLGASDDIACAYELIDQYQMVQR